MRVIHCLLFSGMLLIAGSELSVPASASAEKPEPAVKNCIRPEAIDGDTIRCGRRGYRVSHRLLGIDAPEIPGHCRKGRECAAGDPFASRAALAAVIEQGATVQSFGTDLYKRRLSIVRAKDGQNASCLQLKGEQAIFKPNWDKGRRIARECI